ncbi:MAG: hypothetical protein IID45_07040 [Planctomycetes bacterium]|nr:hypothetical protein [Planctomycetota bacterium]
MATEIRTKRIDADSPTEYLVEDVTVFQLDSKQEIRLSSLFTARERMLVFMEALARRDPIVIRKTASGDFNRRVWNQADAMFLHSSLPAEFSAQARILDTRYSGPVTTIRVQQNGRNLTYVLRNNAGQVRVDDVLLDEPGRPVSLKDRLELQLPIYRFRVGLETGNIPLLQRTSSRDFNRLIWKQAKTVPYIGSIAPRYLQEPLSSVGKLGDQIVVTLGNERHGAKVLINNESGYFVIDDVVLIAGRRPQQRTQLKQSLRTHFAEMRSISPGVLHTARHDNSIQQSSYYEANTQSSTLEPDESAFLDDPLPRKRASQPASTERLDQSGRPDARTREPLRPRYVPSEDNSRLSTDRRDGITADPSSAARAETPRSDSTPLRIIPNRPSAGRSFR